MPFLKAALFAIAIAVLSLPAAAHPHTDSSYIREFPGTVTLRSFTGEKIAAFRISDGARSENLQFRPNNALTLGFGATIRGLGLNFSFKLPYHDSKEDLYGETHRIDLQVHRYHGRLALDIYLQRYRGFHLNDKADVTYINAPPDYPYFPNLRSTSIGGAAMYLFNGDRYSLRSIVNQQDWQLRSAGSWMLGGVAFAHVLGNGDSTILPPNLAMADFLGMPPAKDIRTYGITGNVGYGYNLVIKRHWLISLSGDAGIGPGFSDATELHGHRLQKWGLLINTNARVGAGYTTNKWFAGFYAIYRTDIFQLPYDDSRLAISQGIFRLAVARRLKTNKKFLAK